MSKGHLYQYAVLYHPKPTKDQVERGVSPKSEIVVDISSIVATDDKQVAMTASREIPERYEDKLEDIEILVRPL